VTVPFVEIAGVTNGTLYPVSVVVNQAEKTLTLTTNYNQGGGLFEWVHNFANGTFDLRTISLIYQTWSGLPTEIGRNNFYECFPISYQQISGFQPGTAGKQRLVIAYSVCENATTGSHAGDSLYVPPEVKYYPAEGGDTLSRDTLANRFYLEIEGITSNYVPQPSEWPTLIQGPGFAIERFGTGNSSSGLTRTYALVFDVLSNGDCLKQIKQWQHNNLEYLPESEDYRSLSMIVTGAGAGSAEVYRCNMFDTTVSSINDLGDGYTRVTLVTKYPPSNNAYLEMDNFPGFWGNASMNNPATDTPVDISGLLTDFYPQITSDPVAKTLTLYFDYGEGEALYDWAKQISEGGTATHGKKVINVDSAGSPITYTGCFPISWQLVSGVERAARGKQKVVLSYDSKAP